MFLGENMSYITREVARQNAFIILFEKLFNEYPIAELIEDAKENLEMEFDDFTCLLISETDKKENREKADKLIEDNLKNWTLNRISKPSLVILRLSVTELIGFADIPYKVTINEYVELSKKYTSEEDVSFINGILGSIVKQVAEAAN